MLGEDVLRIYFIFVSLLKACAAPPLALSASRLPNIRCFAVKGGQLRKRELELHVGGADAAPVLQQQNSVRGR